MSDLHIYVTDLEGVEHKLPALQGWRVMEIIKDAGLPIKAECGGACACATWHVYVDDAWIEKLYPKAEEEEDMLDEAFEIDENRSRLSCQILMSKALNGLKLSLVQPID